MHKQQETLSMIKVKDTLAHQRKHEFWATKATE